MYGSKALYEIIWHEGLLYKLKKCAICGKLLDWLSSYLQNKVQWVVIDANMCILIDVDGYVNVCVRSMFKMGYVCM